VAASWPFFFRSTTPSRPMDRVTLLTWSEPLVVLAIHRPSWHTNVHGGRGGDRETEVHRAADVPKNLFHRGPVSIARRMHVEADLLHGVL
jgi:hypothetical protein